MLGAADELPLPVFGEAEYPEETRLKYRFLDLRRERLHANIMLRAAVIAHLRDAMRAQGFTEFQTPILTASSPEGARDFLVPSRLHPGKFYALPQAPQQFKQLIMVAGFDRYFQIAPCFRDEDPRADRSPGEFYQLDMEMSFATQEDVFAGDRAGDAGGFRGVRRRAAGDGGVPAHRLARRDAVVRVGQAGPAQPDPDAGRERALPRLGVQGLRGAARAAGDRGAGDPGAGGREPGVLRPDERLCPERGAAGDGVHLLARADVRHRGGGAGARRRSGPSAPKLSGWQLGLSEGDAAFFLGGQPAKFEAVAGKARNVIGKELGLTAEDRFDFCWIVDFPMYEKDPDTGALDFSHNPFSMPQGGLEALGELPPLDVLGFQYDIVCNGVELSSGAVRNHKPEIMYKAFEIVGHDRAFVDSHFGGMLSAFRYGAPPHAGIAPGIDRIVMLLAGAENIREVIMFPMNQRAEDLMMGAPSEATNEQLRELGLRLVPKA